MNSFGELAKHKPVMFIFRRNAGMECDQSALRHAWSSQNTCCVSVQQNASWRHASLGRCFASMYLCFVCLLAILNGRSTEVIVN